MTFKHLINVKIFSVEIFKSVFFTENLRAIASDYYGGSNIIQWLGRDLWLFLISLSPPIPVTLVRVRAELTWQIQIIFRSIGETFSLAEMLYFSQYHHNW